MQQKFVKEMLQNGEIDRNVELFGEIPIKNRVIRSQKTSLALAEMKILEKEEVSDVEIENNTECEKEVEISKAEQERIKM